jgi:CRISPR-associated Csx2 family protein
MSRKILISFLGTGRISNTGSEREYTTTPYEFNETSYETSIVALALRHFLNIDTLFMFGTMGSAWEALYLELTKNGVKNHTYANELFDKCSVADAETDLDAMLFKPLEVVLGHDSVICPIQYGVNTNEIKNNFNLFAKTLTKLRDGDEIYLDISNSFRSLPLFATTALSYIQDVSGKKVKLVGIYYGMFEAKNKKTGKVPIVNLDYISQLQDWIKGAHSFMEYGNGYLVSDLMKKEGHQSIGEKIEDFTNSLKMNYMHEVKTQKSVLTSLQSADYEGHAKLVLPTVFKSFTDQFSNLTKQSEYQLALANWHFVKKSYAESYLAFIESIVSYVCEKESLVVTDIQARSEAKGLILNDLRYADVKNIFSPANEARKRVAHILENATQKAKIDIQNLKKYLNNFKKIIKK